MLLRVVLTNVLTYVFKGITITYVFKGVNYSEIILAGKGGGVCTTPYIVISYILVDMSNPIRIELRPVEGKGGKKVRY